MTTDATTLGWGNPRDLSSTTMARGDVGLGTIVTLANDDVVVVMRELVRHLVAAGFRPNDARDDGGYNSRLKRWAEQAGMSKATAPLTAWSDHACGTALDVDWSQNAYHDARPGNWRDLTTMPDNAQEIAAPLGLEWGGSWSSPWDPMHFQVAVTPARLAEIAAGIRSGASTSTEDDSMSAADVAAIQARQAQIVAWEDDNFKAIQARINQVVGWMDVNFKAINANIDSPPPAGTGSVAVPDTLTYRLDTSTPA